MALSFTHVSLLVAVGVNTAFALLALSVAAYLRSGTWVALAVMGVLEAGYCALMVPFYAAKSQDEALFWIQLISLFMPFMTWLVTFLTVSIAQLQRHWFARFSDVTLFLSGCFSVTLLYDMATGARTIFTHVAFDFGTFHMKVVRTTALGSAYLVFVSVAFYTSAFFMIRHWRRGHQELLPLIVGCSLYFLSITNDFNVVFGFYDSPFLQHFGFLALYVGFCVYHGLDYLRSVRELEAAYLEIRRHRDRMIEEERVRSLGMLGAFVAHEINNMMQLLVGVTSVYEHRVTAYPDAPQGMADLAKDLHHVSARMSALSQGLRSLALEAKSEPPRVVAIGPIVEGAIEICRYREANRGVAIKSELSSEELELECWPGQLTQVIVNLVNNACDAVAEQETPWVTVAVGSECGEICLSVTDSGQGIPEELRGSIMRPFFTTKPNGRGSGLGLAIVSHIVARHAGRVEIDASSPNTRFVLRLPRKRRPAQALRETALPAL